MDILRTQVGRQFCRHLNTRDKREARRALMQTFRWTKNLIHGDLQKKFGDHPLKQITPTEIVQSIKETAERLAGPDLVKYVIERDEGGGFVLKCQPETPALIKEQITETVYRRVGEVVKPTK